MTPTCHSQNGPGYGPQLCRSVILSVHTKVFMFCHTKSKVNYKIKGQKLIYTHSHQWILSLGKSCGKVSCNHNLTQGVWILSMAVVIKL